MTSRPLQAVGLGLQYLRHVLFPGSPILNAQLVFTAPMGVLRMSRHPRHGTLKLAPVALASLSVLLAAGVPDARAEETADRPAGRVARGAPSPGTRIPSTIAVLLAHSNATPPADPEAETRAPSLPTAVRSVIAELAQQLVTPLPLSTAQGYRGLWFVDFGVGLSGRDFDRAVASLHAAPGVRFASEVRDYEAVTLIPTPELLIVLERGASITAVLERLQSKGAQFIAEYPGLTPVLHVALPGSGIESRFHAREIAAWAEVRSAEVNFIEHLHPLNVPNDPLFASQWALENTGQFPGGVPGADMSGPLAWDVATGTTSVNIAILDEGVDFTHPALASQLGLGYEATDQLSPAGLSGNALPDDAHGTACAGLAAATGNNAIGIAGVCWSATLMPVRIGYANHWSEVAWQVDAITWSTDHGADVLSSSWGGVAPSFAIQASLQYALSVGRNGLGCILVFSAGNTGGPIVYPAKYPEAIAVGATSPCDERKSQSSCDGELTWESCHGLELDLVAPGVKLTTTDSVGPSGSDPGDYTFDFNGTSAACPYVAGAAALLLSLRPDLTHTQTRSMLTSACRDRVGVPSEDTPGWDPFMGWGRLDLRRLVDFATAPAPVDSFDCTVSGYDVTLTWSSPQNFDRVTIERDGGALVTIIGTPTTYTDSFVTTGLHRYTVIGSVASAPSPRAICTALVTNGASDLIWTPPDARGIVDGGAVLLESLIANGHPAIVIEDIESAGELDSFERIWINLGVYPENHVLTEAEAIPLVSYLTNGLGGDSIYLEGGNTWALDPPTSLHSYFQINGYFDGAGDLNTIVGFDVGVADLSNLTLNYIGENEFIDRLLPISPAVSLLRNGPQLYDVAVFHEGPEFRTVGASLEIGGVSNIGGVRDTLIAELVTLLEIPRTPFLRGDANGNGSVNLADAMLILATLFIGANVNCLDALDWDDNGAVDLADAIAALDFLFAQGAPPASPFPAIDIDPTDLDPLDCAQYP